ncbi:DUF397 domain-containing protein [Streptomyces lycii]|uniref:DUF397 domain-containing protein n=2 Tax=Streptomyces lycii TaxID=2654337 RepID=A0ABQ7FBG2_9ACTN|nr:DUF397 domain-containing protein [Streptomyces lycii]
MNQSGIPDKAWFKSSYSSSGATECVEAAPFEHGMAVRDSKVPLGGKICVSDGAWADFTRGIQAGHFSLGRELAA